MNNAAHVHLVFNHFPIVGMIIGIAVYTYGYFFGKENDTVLKTGLFIILGASLTAIPTMLSGEGAEEIVERIPGIGHDVIHHHEEHGAQFFYGTIFMLLAALSALLTANVRPKAYRILKTVVLVGGLLAAFLGFMAGASGGEIRHPEKHNDFDPTAIETHEHDDHDHGHSH